MGFGEPLRGTPRRCNSTPAEGSFRSLLILLDPGFQPGSGVLLEACDDPEPAAWFRAWRGAGGCGPALTGWAAGEALGLRLKTTSQETWLPRSAFAGGGTGGGSLMIDHIFC
jgi:hypothetical protein